MGVAFGQMGFDRLAMGQRNVAQLVLRRLRALEQRVVGLVVVTRNGCQHTQLRHIQFTIRHGHPQHGRITLHIPAVLQAQRAKFCLGYLPSLPARELVAVLAGAGAHKLTVKVGVLVHG